MQALQAEEKATDDYIKLEAERAME